MRRLAVGVLGLVLFVGFARAQEEAEPIPPNNSAKLKKAPKKPAVADFPARAEHLFDSIKKNDADAAASAFLSKGAFRRIKGVKDPDKIFRRLIREYKEHIDALHKKLPDDATFGRFQMSRRCGWVERRQEANALPYWACRHNWIHYASASKGDGKFKVRTLISWGDQWFITHLGEFK